MKAPRTLIFTEPGWMIVLSISAVFVKVLGLCAVAFCGVVLPSAGGIIGDMMRRERAVEACRAEY
jgi:hypothetical protein